MKKSVFVSAVFALVLSGQTVFANGVVSGQDVAAKVAQAIGNSVVNCTLGADKVKLEVGSDGLLRMVADYAGSPSGTLDTKNEGGGEECGGLSAKFNDQYLDYVLDDSYNDCERGDWGYRIMIAQTDVELLNSNSVDHFSANAYPLEQGAKGAAVRVLECTVVNK